jgi:rhamnogalacturonyl hydrolase YesR
MEQYFIHKDKKMMDAMRARLDTEVATPDDAKKPLWWWCDALFMAPPVYADMAVATGDPKYLTFMDHEWDITTNLLYDRSKHPIRAMRRISTNTRRTGKRSFGRAATAG